MRVSIDAKVNSLWDAISGADDDDRREAVTKWMTEAAREFIRIGVDMSLLNAREISTTREVQSLYAKIELLFAKDREECVPTYPLSSQP